MRQKLVLSTTTAPASIHFGAHSELTVPPAEERIRSSSWIDSSVISCTSSCEPAKSTLLPADREEARGLTSAAGNFRSASTRRIVEPTAPVAPAIPTLHSPFELMPKGYGSERGYFFLFFFLHFFLAADAFLPFLCFLHFFLCEVVGTGAGPDGQVAPGVASPAQACCTSNAPISDPLPPAAFDRPENSTGRASSR